MPRIFSDPPFVLPSYSPFSPSILLRLRVTTSRGSASPSFLLKCHASLQVPSLFPFSSPPPLTEDYHFGTTDSLTSHLPNYLPSPVHLSHTKLGAVPFRLVYLFRPTLLPRAGGGRCSLPLLYRSSSPLLQGASFHPTFAQLSPFNPFFHPFYSLSVLAANLKPSDDTASSWKLLSTTFHIFLSFSHMSLPESSPLHVTTAPL